MKPPLALHVEVETETGQRFRWDGDARAPADRPRGLQFKTRIGDGYAEGGCVVPRDSTVTYPDTGKLATHRYIGMDGTIAYEGVGVRFQAGQKQITAEAVGWMSHAKDRQVTFLGVDRDLTRWQSPATQRRDTLIAAGYDVAGPEVDEGSDPRLRLQHTDRWDTGRFPLAEALYDAGENLIAGIYFDPVIVGNATLADANWFFTLGVASNDALTAGTAEAGDLWTGGGFVAQTFTPPTPRRWAYAMFLYGVTNSGAEGQVFAVALRDLAVIGDHGLELIGAGSPKGLRGSDVIRHIARLYCPLIDAEDIAPTSQVLEHVVFRDPITPYDLWRKVNAYERRNLAVWEGRRLHYDPIDDQVADWVIREDEGAVVQIDDPGGLGPYNGAIVRFQNIETMRTDVVSPETHTELADTNPDLPANRYGRVNWVTAQLPDPNSTNGAVAIGRALLEETKRSKEPGTAVIRGHIKDRFGNWQQGYKVRAGDTVTVEDYPDDRPRVIHETTWDDDTKTLTMTLDAAEQTPEAALDRLIGNPARV